MSPARTTIATATRYPDPGDVRGRLALDFLVETTSLGYPVELVDGGSHSDWLADAGSIDGATLHEEQPDLRTGKRTMGAGRRQAMAAAAKTAGPNGVAFWCEPEKIDVPRLIEQIVQPIYRGQADLVIPQRLSLDSYPKYQQMVEPIGNDVVEDLLGVWYDFWFGVVAMPATGVAIEEFLAYEPQEIEHNGHMVTLDDRWMSIMAFRFKAIARGARVVSVPVDYQHPKKQTAAENDPKVRIAWLRQRLLQIDTLAEPLEALASHLHIGRFADQPVSA